MRTNHKKRQHIVLSEDQMKNVYGEEIIFSEEKVDICHVCGAKLSDEDLEPDEPKYTYMCPECGSKGTSG